MTNPSPASEKFHGSTSVSITVKDIQKSAAWYQNVVGFGVDRTFERDGRPVLVALKAGDVRINLNQDDGAKDGTVSRASASPSTSGPPRTSMPLRIASRPAAADWIPSPSMRRGAHATSVSLTQMGSSWPC